MHNLFNTLRTKMPMNEEIVPLGRALDGKHLLGSCLGTDRTNLVYIPSKTCAKMGKKMSGQCSCVAEDGRVRCAPAPW